jgi:hypothetical protein
MPVPNFEKPVVAWDAEGMFIAAGGVTSLCRLLESHGFDAPKLDTAYMWRHRGRVPGAWVPTIVYALLKEKKAKLHQLIRIVGGDEAEDGE